MPATSCINVHYVIEDLLLIATNEDRLHVKTLEEMRREREIRLQLEEEKLIYANNHNGEHPSLDPLKVVPILFSCIGSRSQSLVSGWSMICP